MGLENKISPQVNALRTILFLVLGHYTLTHSAADVYHLFTDFSANF